MNKNFIGLTTVNIELTNKCNKNCWMCGRRKIEEEYPNLITYNKDMEFKLIERLAEQLPPNIIVQFHNNGEPTLFPQLKKALKMFKKDIRCFDTNGILLVDKANDIINNLEVLTISVIENDSMCDEQFENVVKFLDIKKDKSPTMVYRLLGNVDQPDRWYELPGIVATRILHNPKGSFEYTKKPTIPEHGICMDAFSHLAVDVDGNISMCVRFDPYKRLTIGNIRSNYLINVWNSERRKEILTKHIQGKRKELEFCGKCCDYYGIPKGEDL